jgi:hypothetical protein
MTAGCEPCAAAVSGEQVALVAIDDTEVGVLACPKHLDRVALAFEVLAMLEKYHPTPEPENGYAHRIIVRPEVAQ